ncbi:MAG: helix-turn-helix transcriptional regulator [Flavobacteriaceae bacterium]|jgi:transcriptional regulator with XRE-family HTH domain|nr:helix-turn-helix transcriptional regulator [Flavobacteriaceae bacterium]
MGKSEHNTIDNVARNIRQIRELKNFTQEHMADQLGISQPQYAKIEKGSAILKIDRLQEIADILEVDLAALLTTNNIFNFVFNSTANQSGYYINNQHNSMDIEMLRTIIKEEINKIK